MTSPARPSRSAARCVSSSSSPPRACSPAAPISPRRTSARRCRRRSDYPGRIRRRRGARAARDRRSAWRSSSSTRGSRRWSRQALDRNRDLAVAVARIEEARGLYRIQNADRLPTLGASGDVDALARAGPDRPGDDQPLCGRRRGHRLRARFLGPRAQPVRGRAERISRHAPGRARLSPVADPRRRQRLLRLARSRRAHRAGRSHRRAAAAKRLRIARRRLDAGVTSALDFARPNRC